MSAKDKQAEGMESDEAGSSVSSTAPGPKEKVRGFSTSVVWLRYCLLDS